MVAPRCLGCNSLLNTRWGKTHDGYKRPRNEWQCPHHGTLLRCARCCPACVTLAGGVQRGGPPDRGVASSSTAVAGPLAAAAAVPAAAAAARAAFVRDGHLRRRSRSRSEEGRRFSRDTIERRLLGQWREVASISERPLPEPGRADSGIVGYGTWGNALDNAQQLASTRELLRSERWRNERTHGSVHLTLFLAWAEERLRMRDGQRCAGLELGRVIQSFLPR